MLKIATSKKSKHVKIYLEEEFIGSIPEKLLPQELYLNSSMPDSSECNNEFYSSFNNQEHEAEFIDFLNEWVKDNAKKSLLDYVAKAERTSYDCKLFLKRKDIPKAIIEDVIEEFKKKNWISDLRYCQFFTQDNILFGKSPADIKNKLFRKHIDITIIEQVINELYTTESRAEIISELAEKLLNKYLQTETNKKTLFEKIAVTMYRKGFTYEDFSDVLYKKIGSAFDE